MEKLVPITGGEVDSHQVSFRWVTVGCQIASLPTKYLGLPLGAKNKELKVWNEVMERCEEILHLARDKEKKGYNLVKWETLTLSSKQGGLGMRNLSIQNNCLLQKWLWRFCTEDGALWRRFIAGKYGMFSQWTTEEVIGSIGCCV
uniref:Uncharacterized protein n=1 Tax=Solanum tuberosum TaxID=4113 RepID=M1D673_SOLTU